MADATNTPAPTAAPAAVPAVAPVPAAPPAWHAGLDADTQGWVQNKGWDKLAPDHALPEIVKSFRNTERYIGVPADQLLRVPKEGDMAAYNAVYDKLGRPAKPEEYQLEIPKEADPSFKEWAQKTFHGMGLNGRQANELLKSYTAYTEGRVQAAQAEYETKIAADTTKLKSEWGAAEAKNTQIARGAARDLGISAEAIDALEQVLGFAGVMKLFHNIGQKFGEDKFVGGMDAAATQAKAPPAALAQIQALRSDKDFVSRLMAGDVAAKKQWDDLHAQAYHTSAA